MSQPTALSSGSTPVRASSPQASSPGPIGPYGGLLVQALRTEAGELPTVQLRPRILSDLYLIAVGALSPLDGFMGAEEYHRVVDTMTLSNGLPWSIPVVLPATEDEAGQLAAGDRAALVARDGSIAGTVDVSGIFDRDLPRETSAVYGTMDTAHPGVAALHTLGPKCISGRVSYLYPHDVSGFPADNLTPAQTRQRFSELGWATAVAFQTRNPIHRAHEYLQKCALEMVDGLLVHPLVGDTKSDDVPADVRMECYRVLLDGYFPADRVVLSVLPAAMRYAGPREAIFHAIIRRNYGCTHMIVGRDHAGVGDYYGTYDAQRIFDTIDRDALGIEPLKFEHAFWCTVTEQMASAKTSPSTPDQRIFLSGTKLRQMLQEGQRPPAEFTRPEVAEVLMRAYRDAV